MLENRVQEAFAHFYEFQYLNAYALVRKPILKISKHVIFSYMSYRETRASKLTCSAFFTIRLPNVLLKNDVSSGFNGGSCSRNENSFSSTLWFSMIHSVRSGVSAVRISQARLGCLKRTTSGKSEGGSTVISVINSSMMSLRWKLETHEILEI